MKPKTYYRVLPWDNRRDPRTWHRVNKMHEDRECAEAANRFGGKVVHTTFDADAVHNYPPIICGICTPSADMAWHDWRREAGESALPFIRFHEVRTEQWMDHFKPPTEWVGAGGKPKVRSYNGRYFADLLADLDRPQRCYAFECTIVLREDDVASPGLEEAIDLIREVGAFYVDSVNELDPDDRMFIDG